MRLMRPSGEFQQEIGDRERVVGKAESLKLGGQSVLNVAGETPRCGPFRWHRSREHETGRSRSGRAVGRTDEVHGSGD